MKICQNCGSQYADHEAFCPVCGNSFSTTYNPQIGYAPMNQRPTPESSGDANKLAIFNFVFDLLTALFLCFTLMGILSPELVVRPNHIGFNFGWSWLYIAMAIVPGILGFGIVSFIFGLKQKKGDLTKKLPAIFRFILGILLCLFTIIPLLSDLI